MRKILYTIIGLGLMGSQSAAQEQLTLKQSRELALEYNQLIKMAEAGHQESTALKKAAFTNFLPNIKGGANYNSLHGLSDIEMDGFFLPKAESLKDAQLGNFSGLSDVFFPGLNMDMGNINYHSMSVSVVQPLYMGGKIRSGYQMAQLGEEIMERNQILQHSEVIQETDRAYWGLVSVKEKVILARKYKEMLGRLVQDLQNALDLQLVTRNEVLKAKVQYNQADLNLLKAENGFNLSQMALCQVIGKELSEPVVVADSVVVAENQYLLGDYLQKALDQRPELQMLEKKTQLHEAQVKFINADFMPQLGVGAQYLYMSEIDDLAPDQNVVGVTATLSIPIFHGMERKHKVLAAKARKRKSELELERSRDLISLEVQQSYYKLQEAYKQIQMAQIAMDQAGENVKLTQDSFYEGLANATELLDAQAFWQQAYSELIDARINFKMNETSYLKSVGELE